MRVQRHKIFLDPSVCAVLDQLRRVFKLERADRPDEAEAVF